MTPFLELVFVLMVIVFFAKTASYLSVKLGQPSVLGELLVGIFLGPTLIDLTHLVFLKDMHLTEVVIEIGELGVLLLMFIAGLELHLNELARNTKVSALAGVAGVIFPVGFGWGVGVLFGFNTPEALFLGLILGATSVSISAQTLMELNVLRTRVGLGLLGAAVFDDILVILLLSTALAIFGGGGGVGSILFIILRIVIFIALSIAFGIWALPWITRRVNLLQISQPAVSLALVVLLFYGFAAELLGGMAAITGSFIAGLMFARTPEKERIERGVRALAYSLFVPVFFVSIGLSIDLTEVSPNALLLMGTIIVLGIIGKILGSGMGAKLGGFSNKESLQLGAGMVSRGEVGLIVATIGSQAGYVKPEVFSAVIGMVIITTLFTPPLLRALFKGEGQTEGSKQPAGQTASHTTSEKEDTDVHGTAHSG